TAPTSTYTLSLHDALPIFLIDSVASSFFVVLSNVTINDESRLCREMAASILKNLFGKASKETLQTLETYCSAWMSQKSNTMLLRDRKSTRLNSSHVEISYA